MPRKPPKSSEQKLERWSRSMAPGTLNGKVAAASPMSLDVSRLAARMRAQPQPASAGFDPNENPIIIGDSATAGGGSTPDSVSGGTANAVSIGANADGEGAGATAVGWFAEAQGAHAVALGEASLADNDYCISIGADSTASGVGLVIATNGIAIGRDSIVNYRDGIAIGFNTQVFDVEGICIGLNATARESSVSIGANSQGANHFTTAVGHQASAPFLHSSALGADAASTKANQIMLGSSSDFAEIPGSGLVLTDSATGTRYLLRVTSGSVNLTTAP